MTTKAPGEFAAQSQHHNTRSL